MTPQHQAVTASFWRRIGGSGETPGQAAVFALDAHAVIAGFPDAAMLLDGDAKVVTANAAAARLGAALHSGQPPELRMLCAGIAASGKPGAGQIILAPETPSGDRLVYTITGIPVGGPAGGRQILLFARDASAEYAMRQALISSRELYRDLARCSSDFSWQTDENGVFSFVSAKGALGFSAKALNGRSALSLLEYNSNDPAPFITRKQVENVEIHLRDARGGIRTCMAHAVPVYDQEYHWLGARGVCTDITEARLRQRALDEMRARDDQLRAIAVATQRTLEPETGFNEAASIIARAMNAQRCALIVLDDGVCARVLGASEPDAKTLPPGPLQQALNALCHEALPEAERLLQFEDNDLIHHAVSVAYGGRINGAIWLSWARRQDDRGLCEAAPPARSLAQSAANHVGAAIAHANQLRTLEDLSRTDTLTGLLNRRAFNQDIQQRHAHRYRIGRPAALLYIDVDNFKLVNDQFGHAAGDNVLRELAALLAGESRAGDMSARLGGDEFALWLEDTDADGAAAKARHLIDGAGMLARAAGIPADAPLTPLGLSVGIAIADPDIAETLEQLMHRADDAMYRVKHSSKNGYRIAPEAAHGSQATGAN